MPSDARHRMVAGRHLLRFVLALTPVPAIAASHVIPVQGDVAGTHDPSIALDGDTWYVFATGKTPAGGEFAVRCSEDLVRWRLCGQVFAEIPAWIHQRSPGTRELWAPDVSFVHGEYRLYYAYSLFGRNTSGIGLAVSKTLDPKSPHYGWVDKGLVLESKATDNFNAIDPNFVADAQGHGWLSFGSFWDGIKMRRLDDTTGLLSTTDTRLYSLARRASAPASRTAASASGIQTSAGLNEPVTTLPPDSEAIEAPFIVPHGGWFYLFTSWDLCCRGAHSTYHTVVGRSSSVTGPYLDRAGKPLLQGGGTPVLRANRRWAGPGGASVLYTASFKATQHHRSIAPEAIQRLPAIADRWLTPGNKDLIVFHAYDPTSGKPSMQLSTIDWHTGWPVIALATE